MRSSSSSRALYLSNAAARTVNIAFFAAAAAIALCADELTRDRRELDTEPLALRRDRVLEPTLLIESFELISHSNGDGFGFDKL